MFAVLENLPLKVYQWICIGLKTEWKQPTYCTIMGTTLKPLYTLSNLGGNSDTILKTFLTFS